MTQWEFAAPARREALPRCAAAVSAGTAAYGWIAAGRYLPGRYIGECIPWCWNWGPLFIAILILIALVAVPCGAYRLAQSIVRSSEAARVRRLASRPTDRSIYRLVTLVDTLSDPADRLHALHTIAYNCGSLERLSTRNPGPWAERVNSVYILCAQMMQAELVLPLMTVLSSIGTDSSLQAIRLSETAFGGSPTYEMVREHASRSCCVLSKRLAADRAGAQFLRPSADCGSHENLLRTSDRP